MSIEKPLLPNLRTEGSAAPEIHEAAKGIWTREFETQKHPQLKELLTAERKKTAEELEVLTLVNRGTNALIKRYGGEPFDIPSKNVHVLDSSRLPKAYQDGLAGEYYGSAQAMMVAGQPGKIPFAHIAFHEMLHAKSIQSILVDKNGENFKLKERRVGLRLRARTTRQETGEDLLRWMNEAVTEELTIRFTNAYRTMSLVQAENNKTAELLATNEGEDRAETFFATRGKEMDSASSWLSWTKKKGSNSSETISRVTFAYKKEREVLGKLIDALYKKNLEHFKDRQEVFDVFARAMLSGNLLPLGRLIDRTLGVGSFKRFGDISGDFTVLEAELQTILAPSQETQVSHEDTESADPYWRHFNQPEPIKKVTRPGKPVSHQLVSPDLEAPPRQG